MCASDLFCRPLCRCAMLQATLANTRPNHKTSVTSIVFHGPTGLLSLPVKRQGRLFYNGDCEVHSLRTSRRKTCVPACPTIIQSAIHMAAVPYIDLCRYRPLSQGFYPRWGQKKKRRKENKAQQLCGQKHLVAQRGWRRITRLVSAD